MLDWLPDWVNGSMILGAIAGVLAFTAAVWSSVEESWYAKKIDAKNEEIIAAQKEISRLSQETLTQLVGSPDAFLTIHPNFDSSVGGDYDKGVMKLSFDNESKYPMIDTAVGIGSTRWVEMPRYSRTIGDIHPDDRGTLPGLSFTLRKDVDNEIEFWIKARSVTLWEKLIITWNGRGWVSGYSLFKEVNGKEQYLKTIREDFPYIRKQK